MMPKRKGPVTSGTSKSLQTQSIKLRTSVQEQALWCAYTQCFEQFQERPTSENKILAMIAAQNWKRAFLGEPR